MSFRFTMLYPSIWLSVVIYCCYIHIIYSYMMCWCSSSCRTVAYFDIRQTNSFSFTSHTIEIVHLDIVRLNWKENFSFCLLYDREAEKLKPCDCILRLSITSSSSSSSSSVYLFMYGTIVTFIYVVVVLFSFYISTSIYLYICVKWRIPIWLSVCISLLPTLLQCLHIYLSAG